jgi:1-acyl-sn-glycerol-3-phosphate acyltransferase
VEATYGVLRGIAKPLLRFGLRWTIEGAHLIPPRGPVLLASNHTSYLDPLVLAYVADRRHRKVRFLAKAELFDKKGFGWMLRNMQQIPVSRGTTDAASSLRAAEESLRSGELVTVFPEGTISLDLEPMVGKTGTARLAAATGVPVTPIGLWGAHRMLYKGRKPNWRTGIAEVAVVGPPVRVAPADDISEATDRIMDAIVGCVRRARELYPQQPAADEDGWWVRGPDTAVLRSCRIIDEERA